MTIDNQGCTTFPNYWNITLNKKDGTTITPTSFTTYSGIVSISVSGAAYVHGGEAEAFWYRVLSTTGGIAYFNGESSPSTTSYNLTLDRDTTVQLVRYYNGGSQGGDEGGGCFGANMVVRMADGTDKPIGEVYPGSLVKAYNCSYKDKSEELVDSEVRFSSAGLHRKSNTYERYKFSNGTVIDIVVRDRLYNMEENKMKWMDEWEIGEHALTYDGQEVALVSHETINGEIEYHDFICDYSNYFINGLLAGQKTARWPFFPSKGFGTAHPPKN